MHFVGDDFTQLLLRPAEREKVKPSTIITRKDILKRIDELEERSPTSIGRIAAHAEALDELEFIEEREAGVRRGAPLH